MLAIGKSHVGRVRQGMQRMSSRRQGGAREMGSVGHTEKRMRGRGMT